MLTLRFLLMVTLSAILALGGCTASDSSKEQRAAAEKKLSEDRQAAAKLIVNGLARKSGAMVDWGEKLALHNQGYTVDFERVWITKGPILFLGVLEDVASDDQKNYQLFIRNYNVIISENLEFIPEIHLHLTCPKEAVDPLLAAMKKDKNSLHAGGIAVTAHIAKVERQIFFDGKETNRIIVGYGQCVDLVHIGDVLNSY